MVLGSRTGVAALLLAWALAPAGVAHSARDVGDLFRDDMARARNALRLNMREVTDETLFAVAAAGLADPPNVAGRPLIERSGKKAAYADATGRYLAWRTAHREGDRRAAFMYGLSLVLSPPEGGREWPEAYEAVARDGAGLDRALEGVLQAPDKLPLLPRLRYAAADVLVWRASPRLLPLLVTLARSDDRYLRSRGIAGLGVAAYRSRPGGRPAIDVPLREWSVSAVQQGMLAQLVRDAARDGHYRVRAAAALALGLMGNEQDVPLLERLARDKAYLALDRGRRDEKLVVFPVRAEAARALDRFGRRIDPGGGAFPERDVKKATRGGRDVGKDSRLPRDLSSAVRFGQADW